MLEYYRNLPIEVDKPVIIDGKKCRVRPKWQYPEKCCECGCSGDPIEITLANIDLFPDDTVTEEWTELGDRMGNIHIPGKIRDVVG